MKSPNALSLSEEQRAISELPAAAQALVIAAAGTGKTHALAGRLACLVERDGLSAGDEVLVLSFSRAAVAELRMRVGALGGDARFVGASTFDAFATRLLIAGGRSALSSLDYDRRIRGAIELLEEGGELEEIALVRHVLVDEIQDLAGVRAELVKALLVRADCGFTLFGDPAQAIYDYQVAPGDTSSSDLSAWIHRYFAGSLDVRLLHRDYRALTEQTKRIANIGARLREHEPGEESISYELRSMCLGLPTTGLVAASRMLTREQYSSTALLTRTNGEALLTSRKLFEVGVGHRYQRRGEEKAAPGWLSDLVIGLDEPIATRARISARVEKIADELRVSGDALFRLLSCLDPRGGKSIDLRRMADSVRDQDLPEELNQVMPSQVVVSTIHRSKGLEFDRVLLAAVDAARGSDLAYENRVLYVALSRARKEIFHIERPDTRGLMIDKVTGRWVRRGFGPSRRELYEIEVTGRDSHSLDPAGAWVIRADVGEVQEYLKTEVRPGDPLMLELVDQSDCTDALGSQFAVYHQGHPVGVTSEFFGSHLRLALGGRACSAWPRRIRGVHVELVDSVAGQPSVGRNFGLGSIGLWRRVRMFGLGLLEFE